MLSMVKSLIFTNNQTPTLSRCICKAVSTRKISAAKATLQIKKMNWTGCRHYVNYFSFRMCDITRHNNHATARSDGLGGVYNVYHGLNWCSTWCATAGCKYLYTPNALHYGAAHHRTLPSGNQCTMMPWCHTAIHQCDWTLLTLT